jgi:hypothetical protein
MALTPGTKLGPYEVQFPLGAGGMGEIYRARDKRLDRTRTLFKSDIPDFEVSADGKRFLVYKTVDSQEPSSVTLITNWTNALPK